MWVALVGGLEHSEAFVLKAARNEVLAMYSHLTILHSVPITTSSTATFRFPDGSVNKYCSTNAHSVKPPVHAMGGNSAAYAP